MYFTPPFKSIFLLGTLLIQGVAPARILFLFPMSTVSEKHQFEPLALTLASHGHTITFITNTPTTQPHPNITEIVPLSAADIYGTCSDISNLGEIFWDFLFLDVSHYIPQIDEIYTNRLVQEALSLKYDLVFTNLYFGHVFYGILHQQQSPFILLHSFPVGNNFIKDLGLYMPPSHLPQPTLMFTDRMDFFQRVLNFVTDWAVYFHSEVYYNPACERIYRKHLGQDVPSIKNIQKNVSLVMMNTHFLTNYHRPLMPDVVEIGGLHLSEPKPLSKELGDFVNHGDGFIYISFGSVLKSSSIPNSTRQKFVNVFARLRQKVVWKWETEEMEGVPKNVLLKKWLPQQDLLGHPNLRLFITHSGLLSTQQIVYHGAPTIFFPIFFDQLSNARHAASHGIGVEMDFWNFTEKELENTIHKIMNEPRFKESGKKVSEVFKDQINSPMERAVFWTNHVLKYEGARHLRSAARDLNFIQIHSFDVLGFLGAVLIAGVILAGFVLKRIARLLSGLGEKESVSKSCSHFFFLLSKKKRIN